MVIDLPDELHARLLKAGSDTGLTPVEWIARRLPRPFKPPENSDGRTMAERFAGRVGLVGSGGSERISENHSKIFGDMLEEQHRKGRL
jgi:hypothetical protein